MRTLSRPMFNMGGPIKQGIMHGIREPYKDGTRAALVGNPIFPKDKTGRAHHVWNFAIPAVRALAGFAIGQGGKKVSQKVLQEGIKKGLKTQSGTGITAAAPGFWRSAWEGDPLVRSVKWLNKTLRSPTAKGWAEKAAKTVVSPTGVIGGAWLGSSFWPDGTPKDDTVTGVEKPGGFPGADIPEVRVKSQAEKDAFAKSQREKRVNKYLDMMGYDRSKKMAIADALIDASKIVGDRGTLDRKNITRDLINPIIQATSKRLDKPQQIREAVGLMATKAEIEKDLSAETDALAKKLTLAKIKSAEAGLEQTESFEGGMKAFLTLRKGAVAANELEQMARLLANEHNESFTKVTEDTDITTLDNGIYMSGTKIIRLTDGVPKQLV